MNGDDTIPGIGITINNLSSGVLLKDNAFNAAVSVPGFLECLVSLVKKDIALLESRAKSGVKVSFTQHIFCGIFPGYQSEKVDQYYGMNVNRFLMFLRVPGAWEAILDAGTNKINITNISMVECLE
jgi:hypothetical protein